MIVVRYIVNYIHIFIYNDLNGCKSGNSYFTYLLNVEFVQDVSSRGLSLVYNLSDPSGQNELANSLLDQLIGGKRKVNKVDANTELFAEGLLGKTPTG